jgi:hypothetical protein
VGEAQQHIAVVAQKPPNHTLNMLLLRRVLVING